MGYWCIGTFGHGKGVIALAEIWAKGGVLRAIPSIVQGTIATAMPQIIKLWMDRMYKDKNLKLINGKSGYSRSCLWISAIRSQAVYFLPLL